MDIKKLDELYELYGFKKEFQGEDYIAYLYEQGYFTNVEIVSSENANKRKIDALKKDYTSAGYSVSEKTATDIKKIEEDLFSGFFKINSSKNRVKSDYNDFCKLQTRKCGGNSYSYIASKLTINGYDKNENIVETLINFINDDGAQLIILEAPAGFGKTCTSYELAYTLASINDDQIPILAELSKNRSARIFDYVLFSEIDKKFPQLSSRLVSSQIIRGKIPLIIDGFDELLSKSASDQMDSDNDDDAKSMLDTIATLLQEGSNAKIVLTSRKSSMFVGEVFDKWVGNRVNNCTINRIQIMSPTIKDWLGEEKIVMLEQAGIDIKSLANPVLLSVIRNIPLEECKVKFRKSSDVLEYYLRLVLSRERERQQLLLNVAEQRMILQKLAALFVQFDIVSDTPDNIKVFLEDIVSNDIEHYLNRYNGEDDILEPNEEEFLMKLAHNVLLDRLKIGSNNIGFINDFIFGIFIGEAIISEYVQAADVKDQYLSFAISAFGSENEDKINKFIEKLNSIKNNLSADQRLSIDCYLTHKMTYDYIDEYISNFKLDNTLDYHTDHYFYNCTFNNCIFKKMDIKSSLFEGCYFINCTFYDINIVEDGIVEEQSSFVSCEGHEKLKAIIGEYHEYNEPVVELDDLYYEKKVLEQFWMPGSTNANLRKSYNTLFRGVPQNDREKISQAVENLYDKGILSRLTYCIQINTSKMGEVKEILGR